MNYSHKHTFTIAALCFYFLHTQKHNLTTRNFPHAISSLSLSLSLTHTKTQKADDSPSACTWRTEH